MKKLVKRIFGVTTTKKYLFIVTVLFTLMECGLLVLLLYCCRNNRNYHYIQYLVNAMATIFKTYVVAFGAYMARAFFDTVSEKGTEIKQLQKETKQLKKELKE